MEDTRSSLSSGDSVLRGFVLAIIAHFNVVALMFVVAVIVDGQAGGGATQEFLLMIVLTCGLAQLVYLVPLGLWLKAKNRPLAAKGVWLSVAVMFLINASCWGLAFVS